jgi:hypothetical protein
MHFSGGDYCDEKRDYDLTMIILCDQNSRIPTDIVYSETHRCFKTL